MGAWNVLVAFHVFHIIIKVYLACKVKIGLKTKLPFNFKNTCYLFYYIRKFQFLYSIYYKPNVGIDDFKMKNKKNSNLLSCVFVENFHIFKWDFKRITFLAFFNMLSPNYC
jgi:hypothetical protein